MIDKSRHIENDKEDSKILNVAGRMSVPWGQTKDEAWLELSVRLDQTPMAMQRTLKPLLKWAASLTILLLSLFTVYRLQRVEVTTRNAETKLVHLPDGSSVKMNSASKLSYNSLFWTNNRKIDFLGEGLFDIRKHKGTFDIFSDQGHTKVLGTSFNLIARKQTYKVACLSGKVYVTSGKKSSSAILTKGLSVERKKHALTKPKTFNAKNEIAWQFGEYYFDNASLIDIIDEFERQYNVRVILKVADVNRIYTTYCTNKNIHEALRLICLPIGLKYSIQPDNQVLITDSNSNI